MFKNQRVKRIEAILNNHVGGHFRWESASKSGWDIKTRDILLVHLFLNLTDMGMFVYGPTHPWLVEINGDLAKIFDSQPPVPEDAEFYAKYLGAENDLEALRVLFNAIGLRVEKKDGGYEINEDHKGILGSVKDLTDTTPLGFLDNDLKTMRVVGPKLTIWQTIALGIERRFKIIPSVLNFETSSVNQGG